MFKPIAALLLSGVIAVTSLAPNETQAADSEDLAKILFGALVVYGISEAVRDNRRSSSSSKGRVVRPVRRKLPAGCIRTHRQHFGEKRTVFGNQCLKKNYRSYARLPDRCFRRFETVRGTRVGWGPRCLRRAGFNW